MYEPTEEQALRIERRANAGRPEWMPRVWARIRDGALWVGLEDWGEQAERAPAAVTWGEAEWLARKCGRPNLE